MACSLLWFCCHFLCSSASKSYDPFLFSSSFFTSLFLSASPASRAALQLSHPQTMLRAAAACELDLVWAAQLLGPLRPLSHEQPCKHWSRWGGGERMDYICVLQREHRRTLTRKRKGFRQPNTLKWSAPELHYGISASFLELLFQKLSFYAAQIFSPPLSSEPSQGSMYFPCNVSSSKAQLILPAVFQRAFTQHQSLFSILSGLSGC